MNMSDRIEPQPGATGFLSDSRDRRETLSGARDARRDSEAELARRSSRISNARLAIFALTAVAAWFAFVREAIPLWTVAAGIALFIAFAVVHDRALRRREKVSRAVRWYEQRLARLDATWPGTGDGGDEFSDPHHPYASDLDIFGSGSLYEYLSSAQTSLGRRVLASWLLGPAAAGEVKERQEGVRELGPLVEFREELAVVGGEVAGRIDRERLVAWAREPRRDSSLLLRIGVGLLAATVAVSLVLAIPQFSAALASEEPAGPVSSVAWVAQFVFLAAVLGGALVAWLLGARTIAILAPLERSAEELEVLSGIVRSIEGRSFTSARLTALGGRLTAGGEKASASIARLQRLISLLDSDRNILFKPVALLLLWRTQFAFAIEKWRVESGRSIVDWLDAVGEIEALASLAAFAWEHPGYAFPDVVDSPAPSIEAEAIGHPLIADDRVVRNDVALGGERKLLIVSGSNMSGKSTFLRSIGTNAVLALAGSAVSAKAMTLTPLRIGASIRINDSLLEGSSRFYAELLRLRQIYDMAGEDGHLLFLLDEILHGTNSHDRRIGAEEIARTLSGRGAVGLITTHDLALAALADEPELAGANVHFEDQIVEGEMRFDYRLRDGVVTRSNALELMRIVGLTGHDRGPGSEERGEGLRNR
jgi:hypothetical protein